MEKIDKNALFSLIAKSSRFKNLGFFIGSGFSKCVGQESHIKMANWRELLEETIPVGKDKDLYFNRGLSYPQIATEIIKDFYPDEKNLKGINRFKQYISTIVDKSLTMDTKEKWGRYFDCLSPIFAITTNYDLFIEQIMRGKSFTIGPSDGFIEINNLMPVYHIHGCVNDPENIVINNDDYAKTLRFSDYRHSRLPFLFKENTIIFIGYSINDINVLSALDYRNNLYSQNRTFLETNLIQLVYKPDAIEFQSYLDEETGIYIHEYSDLNSLFEELVDYINKYKSVIGKKKKMVDDLNEKFLFPDEEYKMFFKQQRSDERYKLFKEVLNLEPDYWYLYSSFEPFLRKEFSGLWLSSSLNGSFYIYDYILNIVLDLAENLNEHEHPDFIIDIIFNQIDNISYYVGSELGQSFAANNTWLLRKNSFPIWLKEKLINTEKYSLNYYTRKMFGDFKEKNE